ncbi:glycosyltransferase family 92 protein [Lentibacter algarum]|uniref:glycosyltransferase family 92 protein n=1 Tax=Lentibacter algarum TaxID=576131 RepID=UPI002492C881|nr:glycosyltransferase family 92 protein [Lentibacter algarum]
MRFFKARPISKLAVSPPKANPERSGVAIPIIVKNEARYIEEWARFHLLAGVSHFIVYDNGSTDETVSILRDTVPAEALTIVPWAQSLRDGRSGAEIHNQVLAFSHALANYGAEFRWMAFVDVDEFIVPKADASIEAALERVGEAAHVSLPWQMFGRGGHEAPPEGGIVGNYTRRMRTTEGARYALNWKCIVDPSRVTGVRVHGMEIDGKGEGVNDAGVRAAHSAREKAGFYSAEFLQLNHYYTRSNNDLQAKLQACLIASVALQQHARRVMRIVAEIEADEVEDVAAIDFLARAQGK